MYLPAVQCTDLGRSWESRLLCAIHDIAVARLVRTGVWDLTLSEKSGTGYKCQWVAADWYVTL